MEDFFFVFISIMYTTPFIYGIYMLMTNSDKSDDIYALLMIGVGVFLYTCIKSSENDRQRRRGVPDVCIGCSHMKQRRNYYSQEYSRRYRIEYGCDKMDCYKRKNGFVATRSDYKYYKEKDKW